MRIKMHRMTKHLLLRYIKPQIKQKKETHTL